MKSNIKVILILITILLNLYTIIKSAKSFMKKSKLQGKIALIILFSIENLLFKKFFSFCYSNPRSLNLKKYKS